jgi:hypothetical protein
MRTGKRAAIRTKFRVHSTCGRPPTVALSTGRGGRQQEAVDLLAPVLGWFEEGVDTADLQAARTLLDELTEPAIDAKG